MKSLNLFLILTVMIKIVQLEKTLTKNSDIVIPAMSNSVN